MKKLSDSDLQTILQQKMLSYEADVPQEADDAVIGRLNHAAMVNRPGRKVLKYSLVAALIFFSFAVYFTKEGAKPQDSPSVAVAEGSQAPAISQHNEKKQTPPNEFKNDNLTSNSVNNESRHAGKTSQTLRNPTVPDEKQNVKQGISARQGEKQEQTPAEIVTTLLSSNDASSKNQIDKEKESAIVENDSTEAVSTPVGNSEDETGKKKNTRFRFVNIGVTPFLSYRRIQPNRQDGVQLSEFSTPAALSAQRFGLRISTSAEYEIAPNRYLALGLAYTHYNTTFSYKSNEIIRNVDLTNHVSERVSALGLFAAFRYPIRAHSTRLQYVSIGIDGQALLSKHNPQTGKELYSISLGYANDLPFSQGTLRVTPTVNYSLTRFQYGGVQTQPFWMGVEAAWSFSAIR